MIINKKYSFKEKISVAFILISIIPLCILAVYNFFYTFKSTDRNIRQYTESNMKTCENVINDSIEGFKNMVEFISNNEQVISIMSDEKNNISKERYFDHTQKLYNISTTLIATLPKQMPLHIVKSNKVSRFSTTEYYKPIYSSFIGNFYKLMDNNQGNVVMQIHRRYDEALSKDIVMIVGKAIIDKNTGKNLGYVIIEILDDYFDKFINNISFFKDTNVYILDNRGYVITDKINKNETGCRIDLTNINNTYLKEKYYLTKGSPNIKILSVVKTKNILKELYTNIKMFLILIVIVLVLVIKMVNKLSKTISKPIHEISVMMREVEKGNRNVKVTYDAPDEIGDLSVRFNDMISEINRLIDKEYNQRLLIKQAEFKVLKAQINPHFLYNSLSSINWMAKLGEKKGVIEMTNALSRIFRYSCRNDEEIVFIKEEINQIKDYLIVQKYRYGDKLNIFIDIEEDILEKTILKLILQPIVENAIVHGLEEKIGEWVLIIKGYMEKENIIFKIIDNGVGVGKSKKTGEGIGIKNVESRIKIQYGEGYGVENFRENNMTVFKIKLKG